MSDPKNTFEYTYSAKDKEEIKAIRSKYVTKAETADDKMAYLRNLDAGVERKAAVTSLIFGIVGLLIMGFGMSLFMSALGEALKISPSVATPVGVAIGVVGIVLVVLAYPVYGWVTKKERKRIAPEVLKLTEELMK